MRQVPCCRKLDGSFSTRHFFWRSIASPRRPKDCQLPTPSPSTMISRSSLARTAQQAARRSCRVQQRTFAAAASTGSYETSDVSGLKVAARDAHGPTTKLAIVAKAGTRFQPLPGLTVGLEEFAFKVRSLGYWDAGLELICWVLVEHFKAICPSHHSRI